LGTFITHDMIFPIFGGCHAGIRKGSKSLLAALTDEGNGNQRQARIGTALKKNGCILCGNLDFSGCQQLKMLTFTGRMLNGNVQTFILKEAFFLCYIRAKKANLPGVCNPP